MKFDHLNSDTEFLEIVTDNLERVEKEQIGNILSVRGVNVHSNAIRNRNNQHFQN